MDKKLKRQLYDLVADDQVDEAIDLLQDELSIDHPSYLRLIKLARRFRELDDQAMDAIIAQEDAMLAKNQIADTLLHIVQTMDRPPLETSPPPSLPPTAKAKVSEELPPVHRSKPKGNSQSSGRDKEGFFGAIQYSGSFCMKEKTITVAYGYADAWNRCLMAIEAAGMNLNAHYRASGSIEASTPGNYITSYGERILLFVTPINGHQTRIHLIVDSVLKTMMLDWGRNNKKLNLLVSYLL